MTFSDLKDDVLRWMNPIIHPLEWTKDNFAERDSVFGSLSSFLPGTAGYCSCVWDFL